MRLLLDQGLPRSAAKLLREAGIDTVHVGDIGYSTADDAAILEKGREEKRIVITFDADFHALLALSRAATPSVIRIRIEGLYGKKAADLIQAVLTRCVEDLKQGAVVTVRPKRIRVRRLPLLS
jgi:predicted nuclease of predicted toxin-antitoxin system